MKIITAALSISFIFFTTSLKAQPVRVVVAGISHGHHSWILGRPNDTAMEVVGIYEADKALAEKLMKKYQLPSTLFYSDLNIMLDKIKPEGVLAFGNTLEHKKVVEACAPKGIHVMVEKPLATSWKDAEEMARLAKEHKILLLTNFETSWYPTTDRSYALTRDTNFMGKIRKVVIHDGHEGPKEIGVSSEFLQWLTDPILNGGGALMDFGCYGANIMTMLMNGESPISVTAVTSQYKPNIYPKVEDEATIILQYPSAQCIIQASWNWPYSRKDMAIYGEKGYIITKDNNQMVAKSGKAQESTYYLSPQETKTYTSPFNYFADAIRKRLTIQPFGAYSIENNLIVMKILEAAKKSAKTNKTIKL